MSNIKNQDNNSKKTNWIVGGALFLFSLIATFLFDGNSPFYKNQPATDPNYYFSVGSALNQGKVLYQDTFDQKGPYMYWLHQLGLKLTPNRGWGVAFIEAIILTITLYLIYKIAKQYLSNLGSLIVVAMMPVFLFNTRWYIYGDTAESYALPVFLLGILLILKVMFHPNIKLGWWRPFVFGISISLIFWMKFTLAISPLLLALLLLLMVGKYQGAKEFWRVTLWGVLGMIIPTIIVLGYFAAHKALKDLYHYYFYVNIFLYNGPFSKSRRLLDLLFVRLSTDLKDTLLFPAALIVLISGILTRSLIKHKSLFDQVIFALMVLSCFASSLIIPKSGYYAGTLVSVVPLAFIQIIIWINDLTNFDTMKVPALLGTVILGVSLISATFVNDNILSSRLYIVNNPIEILMKSVKNDHNGSLMVYRTMDFGFYHFADKVPYSKFPAKYNIPQKVYPAPYNDWNQAISKKSVKYIVTDKKGRKANRNLKKNYRVINKVNYNQLQGGYFAKLYLYERK